MTGPIDFTGKTVLITGAGSGLGRAHALAFAQRGANVVVNDPANAETVAAEINDGGGKAIAHAASVTDGNAVGDMVEIANEAFGSIDILVNNAGILRDKSFQKMSDGDWRDVIDVHLHGAWTVTHAVWPDMREREYGRIIMTTSSSGLFGNFGQANYGAAKMALVGMMLTLAIEGEKAGIKVNAVAPIAWTAMTQGLFPPGTKELMAPENVAPALLYLASEDAPQGTILAAGGGAYASVSVSHGTPFALHCNNSPEALATEMKKRAENGEISGRQTGPGHTIQMFQAAMPGS
ncbi:MAG: SDR family NAD(P)-dependent oxidoreductase [Pseudomonadota bacterium]